ncbi:MAG: metN, partial [Naasia sp.]|nr:metN [Naasia sp.]
GPPDVPVDWIIRLADDLGAPAGLLGAGVELVDGRLVGRVSVSVPAEFPDIRVLAAIERLGLHGRPADEDTRAPLELEPEAVNA